MIVLDAFGNPVYGGPDFGTCLTVPTLADLRDITVEPRAGDMVVTLGGAAQGDGNGTFWYWVPNSTLPDDGVNIVKCDAILAGRFYRNGLTGTGITQLTGAVTAGPGSASQVASISAGVVGATELANNAVTTVKIQDDAVTTAKILNSNVTAAKLASDSVTTAKILDSNVTNAKLASVELKALGGLTSAANKIPYFTGSGTAGLVTIGSGLSFSGGTLSATGGSSSSDLRAYAASRAASLLGITNPVMILDEPFLLAPGSGKNWFATASGGGTTSQRTDRNGGWTVLSSTSSAGTSKNIAMGGPTLVSNVSGSKWYQLWLFSIDTAVESGTQYQMGWIDIGLSSDQPTVGAIGTGSTTKFRAFDNTTGANSSVDLDAGGIHIFEQWHVSGGAVRASVDAETLFTYTTAKTAAVQPFAQVYNGSTAAVRSLSLGHLYIFVAQSE